jgi:hypothetical protein
VSASGPTRKRRSNRILTPSFRPSKPKTGKITITGKFSAQSKPRQTLYNVSEPLMCFDCRRSAAFPVAHSRCRDYLFFSTFGAFYFYPTT